MSWLLPIGLVIVGAIFAPTVIEWVSKVPVLGDTVKGMADGQNKSQA